MPPLPDPDPSRDHGDRRPAGRRPLASLVLSAVAVPLLGFPPSVVLAVDDGRVVVRARVATVAEALEVSGVVLSDGDLVSPGLDTPLGGGAEVRIARAVDVTVLVNGAQVPVRTTVPTVAGALGAAGLLGTLTASTTVSPSLAEQVSDGDVVTLTRPVFVTVVDGGVPVGEDGHVRGAATDAGTVREALAVLGVELGLLDRVLPDRDARIEQSTTITVSRVEMIDERLEVPIPRELLRVDDPTLARGVVRVGTAGSDGLRIDRVLVTRVDGAVESRLVLSSTVAREPVTRVERIGTRVVEGDSIWDELARCEAGGRWDAVRRVSSTLSYHGGLQFHPGTWDRNRPADFPAFAHEATREQQILVGERVLARQGWGAWPACARRLGLR